MPEHPVELPAESESGATTASWARFRGGVGGPAELPPPDWARISLTQLVTELFRLRDRVHLLESDLIAVRMRTGATLTRGVMGGPNELPEGEGGGSGGRGGRWPGEIHELPELPVSRLVADLGSLVTRFTQFENQVNQQLGAITQRLDAMKR